MELFGSLMGVKILSGIQAAAGSFWTQLTERFERNPSGTEAHRNVPRRYGNSMEEELITGVLEARLKFRLS
jgi:hypothetical protein